MQDHPKPNSTRLLRRDPAAHAALRNMARPSAIARLIAVALLGLGALSGSPAGAEPWPYLPFDEEHGIGNHYGEYQSYGGSPYYHDGIDLVTPAPVATYSVSPGTVTHLTYNQPLYSGIMIGEPVAGGQGWLYWHINSTTFQFDIGDQVAAGDYIGHTANWPVYAFHHVHFNRVAGTGGFPWGWYLSIDNPLEFLVPRADHLAPVFETTYGGEIFAFARNQSNLLLPSDALTGDVDIVARMFDIVGMPQWRLNPWRVDYWIDGAEASVPLTNTVTFTGQIPASNSIGVIYRSQSPLFTQGDYDNRIFYINLTNTDGDGFVESTDAAYSWQTDLFPAGDYWVHVQAADIGGNVTHQEMLCTIAGVVEPEVQLPTNEHDFGTVGVGASAAWSLIVANQGSDPLSVRALTSSNPVFHTDRAHFFVAPGEQESVEVTFTPPDALHYFGTLTVETNDPQTPAQVVSLSGIGADPSSIESGEPAEPAAVTAIQYVRTRPGNGITVSFALNSAAPVRYEIYDLTGRRMAAGDLGVRAAGPGEFVWGLDRASAAAPSGVYLIRVQAGREEVSLRGLLLR